MAEDGSIRCGLCGEATAREDVARGRKLSMCRGCVQAGLAATLRGTAAVRDGETAPRAYVHCSVCGDATPPEALFTGGHAGHRACTTCLYEGYTVLTQLLEMGQRRRAFYPSGSGNAAAELLARHFGDVDPAAVVTSTRQFPIHLRADLQLALDGLFDGPEVRCVGLHGGHYGMSTLNYAALLQTTHDPVQVAPLQYEDVDIGDAEPVHCLRNALWLVARPDAPHAVLLCAALEYGQANGWHVEICVAAGEVGAQITREYFRAIETAIEQSASYRGKVLSFECHTRYRGTAAGSLLVHRLAPVSRDDIILPPHTLELLSRNVFEFVRRRDKLRALGMPTKKGLLFYGPPGTGKTHTIRWLAGELRGHTTFIVTAEQVSLIRQYMMAARLLSPAIVVIEDVDLIARHRGTHETPGQESLLNQLLNEMDGLRENADVLFVLTTNNPESLETALAGRPGRIDQAIEFPLPDQDGRRRLVDLYRRNLRLAPAAMDEVVRRTEGVSASFIKELMRRTAQFACERDPDTNEALLGDVDQALTELLFDGGSLNATLLGAAAPKHATTGG